MPRFRRFRRRLAQSAWSESDRDRSGRQRSRVAQHQPPRSAQDERRNPVAAAGRADRAQPHPRPRRGGASDRADGRPGDHREQRALRRCAHPGHGAYRERDRVQPARGAAIRAVSPSGRPSWHRSAGRILVPAGVLVALSGLWMTVFYPRPPGDGASLVVVRLVVGSGMLASMVLAVLAIRRRDFTSHGAWMTRGYAIALGAGTQVFTMLPWVVIFGPIGAVDELPRTVLMTAGWVINLAVAEYVIRRRGQRPRRTSPGVGRAGG